MKSGLLISEERKSVAAGKFYQSSPGILTEDIKGFCLAASRLMKDTVLPDDELLAIISPHAGYIFSGTVAASSFLLLKDTTQFKRVIIIGSSHYERFEGASVYFRGHYQTPLGNLEIDEDFASGLLDKDPVFCFRETAHKNEHSIEVQLPFLQYFLKNDFKIVPILLGSEDTDTSAKIAEALKPMLGGENLFVISTDLSHYPEYQIAQKVDKNTIDALCLNEPEKFLKQIKDHRQKNYDNLLTSMCGWTSVLTLLYMTSGQKDLYYLPLLYQNSGDIPVAGDRSRVVGYQSAAVYRHTGKDDTSEMLTEIEKEQLLTIAYNSISKKLLGTAGHEFAGIPGRNLSKNLGAFVSVYINDILRGCIGRIETNSTLRETVEQVSVMSATGDSRFYPITGDEIDKLNIEISVLSPLKKIGDIGEIIPGKHGILIRKGLHSGTFLPQIAERNNWNTVKMLEECSDKKAGMGRNGWKDADIYIYEAVVFSGTKDSTLT